MYWLLIDLSLLQVVRRNKCNQQCNNYQNWIIFLITFKLFELQITSSKYLYTMRSFPIELKDFPVQ